MNGNFIGLLENGDILIERENPDDISFSNYIIYSIELLIKKCLLLKIEVEHFLC